jgi:adenosylhomocysteine nucleosidase
MPRELRPLVRALSLRRTEVAGRPAWRGRDLVAASIGVGPAAARRAASQVIDVSGASGVLVIGVAGACDPTLRVADVVNPSRVVDASDGSTYRPHAFLPAGGPGSSARDGTLVTVAALGAPVPPGATAVDMETAAVAAECAALGVPWDVRRAISDVPGSLPPSVGSLLRPDGKASLGAVVRLLVREPAQVVALARLGRDTGRAISAVTAVGAALLGPDDDGSRRTVPPPFRSERTRSTGQAVGPPGSQLSGGSISIPPFPDAQ